MDMNINHISNMPSGFIMEAFRNTRVSEIVTNPSSDYNGLALLLSCTENLIQNDRQFIYTYNPHRFYMSIQNINSNTSSKINTYA